MSRGLGDEGLDLDKLEDPGDRYQLQEVLGTGVNSLVHLAIDTHTGNKKVAIKIQRITNEKKFAVEEEYKILRDLSEHPNLPDFYGVYKKFDGDKVFIWFVMQLCEGGPVTDLVRALIRQNKKMSEQHIAFILRETLKALLKLHENHVIHRDVKGSNILLTKEGEVKLVDFGLSREMASTLGKCQTSIGSPSWMAPEVVISKGNKHTYDNRADVWALGITAIELGDGKAPFEDMHPTRALFQIVRNPPPTLYRPANWSQTYNDFIQECLEKNPEHRPFMSELMEHPFFTELPENDVQPNGELKVLLESLPKQDIADRKKEVGIRKGFLKKGPSLDPEPMFVEDLAALETINEDTIVQHLEARYKQNQCYTFIGDVLLYMNPNKILDIYGYQHYSKYKFKSRSDNEPHIFSVADSAYQDMLHHNSPQHIILSGETLSGKTQQFKQLLKHVLLLGQSGNKCGEKIKRAIEVIHAFGNAATPLNGDSTRHALYTQITHSSSGKTSGAIFWLYQLEKWRVTGNRSPYHANFHVFYYFLDGLKSANSLSEYTLDEDTDYCYLRRTILEEDMDPKAPSGPREYPDLNPAKFDQLKENLTFLDFEEAHQQIIWNILAAIILLGEVEFKEDDDGNADIKDAKLVDKVASLLSVDGKKVSWSLCNYCVIEKDTAARRRHSRPEALSARNVLAQTLYTRLVDWIVNMINYKLSFSRAVFGDHHCLGILDLFGFECYPENSLEQLFINSLNEQLQYCYNQKIYISEMQETEEEEIEVMKFLFYDNKETMDELLNKPFGIMHLLDEATKLHYNTDYVFEMLNKKKEGTHVRISGAEEFSVAHYTGKVNYDASAMCNKNHDFLPPEITEILRFSTNPIIKQLFTNKLNRTGNLTINVEGIKISSEASKEKKSLWGAALLADTTRKPRPYNTASKGEFSQTRGIRTGTATFKSISLELLRMLSTGSNHFVRCLRTDLSGDPGGFQQSIIRQQLRALSVIDTAKARRSGFSHRITFPQFLHRYKFLAFDFDETVDNTKDNCRLLLIRLKMEGWILGSTKVFLKYYNEEYLSRLYETQVKKIIKVQSMLRAFLAKRNVANKRVLSAQASISEPAETKTQMSQNTAAVIIQKSIKGYVARKKYGSLINVQTGKLNEETVHFIRRYFNRWRAKSMYQVLLLYRAAKYQDLVYFCQQVHLYNLNIVSALRSAKAEPCISNSLIRGEDAKSFVGNEPLSVWKIPFRLKDQPYCDSSHLRGSQSVRMTNEEDVPWDEAFKTLDKGCQTSGSDGMSYETTKRKKDHFSNFIETPYNRDPKQVDNAYSMQIYKYDEDEDNYNNTFDELPTSCGSRQSCSGIDIRGTKDVSSRVDFTKKINQFNQPPVQKKEKQKNTSPTKQQKEYQGLLKPPRVKPGKPDSKVNPIAELELKGRNLSKNDSQNEDDPPFNFQAMLRKTNHKRGSLRRSFELENDVNENLPINSTKTVKNKDIENNNIASHKDFPLKKKHYNENTPFIRTNSFEKIKLMIGTSNDFEKDPRKKKTNESKIIYEENENDKNVFKTEILPGLIIVGGEATDL